MGIHDPKFSKWKKDPFVVKYTYHLLLTSKSYITSMWPSFTIHASAEKNHHCSLNLTTPIFYHGHAPSRRPNCSVSPLLFWWCLRQMLHNFIKYCQCWENHYLEVSDWLKCWNTSKMDHPISVMSGSISNSSRSPWKQGSSKWGRRSNCSGSSRSASRWKIS